MNIRSFALLGLTAFTLALLPSLAGARSLTEFSADDGTDLDWKVVNDGVMGGLSQGKISLSKAGVLEFEGTLSLENNGGFSSLRTKTLNLDLSDSKGFTMRVKGDGRTYQVRLGSDATYRGMEVSFKADVPTTKGEWTVVRVPFSELTGSWRGRSMADKVFNPSKVRRLGLLIGDKKAGPFVLEVDWIRTYGADKTGSIVETALADGRFKTLATALTKAELVDLLQGEGPFTVFAPTDEAFAKLPKGTVESLLEPENRGKLQAILKYHVSPGATNLAQALAAGSAATAGEGALTIAFDSGKVQVNEATLVNADLTCSNGVIHVIDSVLLPPTPVESNTILGVAKRAGDFSTLLAAVEAAGLTETLEGEGPLTILAPTDEAFASLPKGTLAELLKPENVEQLKSILAYHAIPGAISAGDALNAKSAKTLNGQAVAFAIKKGLFQVNGVTILTTDIPCDNGVIHVLEGVLIPSQEDGPKKTTAKASGPSAAKLIEQAIERGVPVFNNGDPAKCADIYRACLEQIAVDERMETRMRNVLGEVLKHAEKVTSATERAWIYRGAMDRIYQQVAH